MRIKLPIEKYLSTERQGQVKMEYHQGDLYAMAGGTLNHTTLCTSISAILYRETKRSGTKCRALNSKMKIEIKRANRYVYPDASVVCGPVEESDKIKGAIRNPVIVVEIISEDSAGYDRGPKMRYYLSLPSVREYLLIEQDRPAVSLYRREGPGTLGSFHYADGLDDSLHLATLNVDLSLRELYEDVDLKEVDPLFPEVGSGGASPGKQAYF
jgi:Uma2 family endonuclease